MTVDIEIGNISFDDANGDKSFNDLIVTPQAYTKNDSTLNLYFLLTTNPMFGNT